VKTDTDWEKLGFLFLPLNHLLPAITGLSFLYPPADREKEKKKKTEEQGKTNRGRNK
jgi:hypothetical protein